MDGWLSAGGQLVRIVPIFEPLPTLVPRPRLLTTPDGPRNSLLCRDDTLLASNISLLLGVGNLAGSPCNAALFGLWTPVSELPKSPVPCKIPC